MCLATVILSDFGPEGKRKIHAVDFCWLMMGGKPNG